MPELRLKQPKPDMEEFVRVIRGEREPSAPPLVELYLDQQILREIAVGYLDLDWVEPGPDRETRSAYLKNFIAVHHRLGYDYLRISGGLDFGTSRVRLAPDTACLSKGDRGWTEEGTGPIASHRDFEEYPWPDPSRADLFDYEFVSRHLPEGMGLLVCPTSGFLEVPLNTLLGYQNLSYLLYDDPELVARVFQKTGDIIYRFYQQLLGLPGLYGFFQGDDMGYKTGTMISADHLRRYVLPWHTKLAELAHQNSLLYLLHSCGNLTQIMEDLLEEVRIDGRHSFEDEGNPVVDFKQQYGVRTAVLGGVDMDKLCRLPEDALRKYVRGVIAACLPGGRFALGSGNTVANYVPVENYLAMVEEGENWDG